MYQQFLAGPVSERQTTQSYKPGEIVTTQDATYGTRVWRYIKNGDVIALQIGTVVERKAATDDNMTGIVCVTASKRKGFLLGVVQDATIAVGSYGFVLKEGRGVVKAPAAATITAADLVIANGEATYGGGKTANPATLAEVLGVIGDCLVTSSANAALTSCNFCIP